MDQNDERSGRSATPIERDTPPRNRPGRTWSERFQFPLKFRHYTGIDAGGRDRIFFKFELPPGETKLDPEALALVRGFKWLGDYPTGLKFERDRLHGKVFILPNNPVGRAAAETLSAKLIDLGCRMDKDESRGR